MHRARGPACRRIAVRSEDRGDYSPSPTTLAHGSGWPGGGAIRAAGERGEREAAQEERREERDGHAALQEGHRADRVAHWSRSDRVVRVPAPG
jgi:hypothetical protein